jgi:hypothetical protein
MFEMLFDELMAFAHARTLLVSLLLLLLLSVFAVAVAVVSEREGVVVACVCMYAARKPAASAVTPRCVCARCKQPAWENKRRRSLLWATGNRSIGSW